MSTTDTAHRRRSARSRLPRGIRTAEGLLGTVVVVLVCGIALLGPSLAPHADQEVVGTPLAGPSADALLGTDILGRDVFSRVLLGGVSLLAVALGATVLAYLIGASWGMLVTLRSRLLDTVSIGAVDVVLSLPPLIVALVLLAGAGSGTVVVAVALAAVQVPRVFRIVRAASREVVTQDYVEAAFARGDSTLRVLRRDVLPNIVTPLLADFGVRITSSIILVSSLSFLGLGAPPPQADWGLMINENRTGILVQPWGVMAPALLIAALSVGINLITDGFSRAFGGATDPRDA